MTKNRSVRALALSALCVLMLLESLALIHTRWVEDDSWYSSKGWTLATEGRIRMAVFPFDAEYQSNVITTLHAQTLGGMFALFGVGMAQARVVSAIFAAALVVVSYFLAADIAGALCGILAALVTATDSFLVVAARTARPEAETALFCWLALLLLERAIARRSPWLGLAAGLACGLGLMCHPIAFPFFAAMALACLLQYRWGTFKEPLVWAMAGGIAVVMVPYLAWCFSDAAHITAFRAGYLERVTEPLHERIFGEAARWYDFLGVSSRRVPLLPHVPLRLHVVLILIVALAFFARRDRRFGRAAIGLLVLDMGWLLFLVNKGPRYLVMLTPLFAIALAYLVAKAPIGRPRQLAAAALALVLVTQLAGNAYWLYHYRHADYAQVSKELQAIVPPGASVYGIITFWMALHDRPYYAYDRTDFDRAIAELRPQYLILYDRVMMHGSGYEEDTYARLRARVTEFVRSHAQLAGKVSNDFYGDLEVYRVAY